MTCSNFLKPGVYGPVVVCLIEESNINFLIPDSNICFRALLDGESPTFGNLYVLCAVLYIFEYHLPAGIDIHYHVHL